MPESWAGITPELQQCRAYLTLRGRLLGRALLELGWLRLLLFVPIALALLAVVGQLALKAISFPHGQWLVPIGVLLLLASVHRQRTDLRFLATNAPAYRHWLAVEYGLWALPAAIILVFQGNWVVAGSTLVLAPWAAAVPVSRVVRSTRHRVRSPFRSEAFEWVSGLRAGGWAWPVLFGVALWYRANPWAPSLALSGWLLVILSQYGVPEPVTMLVFAGRSPGAFLRRRLALGFAYTALTVSPFIGLLAVGPAGLVGAFAAVLASLGVAGLIILTKYAFYPVALHMRIMQGLVICLAGSALTNPAQWLLLVAVVGRLIWQSRRRLAAHWPRPAGPLQSKQIAL